MSLETKIVGNDTEEDRMLNKYFKSVLAKSFIEIGKDKFILSSNTNLDYFLNFPVSDDNIFVACHPKTGSSWLQEAVWLINNDLDYDKLGQMVPIQRFCFFDGCGMDSNFDEIVKQIKDPKVLEGMGKMMATQNKNNFKTHLYWSLLPKEIQDGTKKPKIFVTLRNPYDVCISYYHFCRLAAGYTGNFEQFCQLFMAGRVLWGPYWKNVLSYWEQRHRSNIMFIQYREMIKDFPSVMRKVATFLGKTLTEPQITKLTEFLSFENMKKHPALNKDDEFATFHGPLGLTVEKTAFIREGKEGAYKSIMSPELLKQFDAWFDENIAGTGLSF